MTEERYDLDAFKTDVQFCANLAKGMRLNKVASVLRDGIRVAQNHREMAQFVCWARNLYPHHPRDPDRRTLFTYMMIEACDYLAAEGLMSQDANTWSWQSLAKACGFTGWLPPRNG